MGRNLKHIIRIALQAILLWVCNYAYGQYSYSIRDRMFLHQPLQCEYPTEISTNNLDYSNCIRTNKRWLVFTDRMVYPYTDPFNGTKKPNSISAFKPFYVIRDSLNFLQLVTYSQDEGLAKLRDTVEGNWYVDIPKDIDENPWNVGWVEKEYLLLCPNCLKTGSLNFSKRALVIKRDIKTDSAFAYFKQNKGRIRTHSSPVDTNNLSTLKLKTFNVVYPYKTVGDKCLVSFTNSLVPKANLLKESKPVLGWIDTNLLTIWKNNLCLDINDSVGARNSMAILGVWPTWWPDNSKAHIWKNDFQFREGNIQRVPHLSSCKRNELKSVLISRDSSDHDIVEVAGLTHLYNSLGQVPTSYVTTDSFYHRVKVVFVISFNLLWLYRDEISSAIAEIENAGTSIAIVIAFDRGKHPKCSNGFTSASTLNKWLSNYINKEGVIDYDNVGISDNILEALDSATEMFASPLYTNVIVVMGEKRDTSIKFYSNSIEQKIARKNVSIHAFQLTTVRSNEMYDDFYRGISQIQKNASEIRSSQLERENRHHMPDHPCEYRNCSPNDSINHYLLSGTCALNGGYVFPAPPKLYGDRSKLSINYLTKYVVNLVKREKFENIKMEKFAKNIIFGNPDTTQMSVRVFNFVSYLDSIFSSKKILYDSLNIVKRGYEQYFRKVYTSIHVNGMTSPVFKSYLWSSQAELLALDTAMQKVNEVYRNRSVFEQSDVKFRIVNLARRIAHSYVGGENVILFDTLKTDRRWGELLQMLYHSNVNCSFFEEIDRYIKNEQTTNMVDIFVDFFGQIYERFHNFPVEYTYKGYGEEESVIYYYIPEDYLLPPGLR
jgi:hypothetical protein